MGRLFRLVRGLWSKSPSGEWSFDETPYPHVEAIIINRTDSIEGLVEMIRITLNLGILTPVALTYQLPEWMLMPDVSTTPPITLHANKDIEILASVAEYMTDPVLYVTSGPELVAKYQFFCRTPFRIDDKTYLAEGVTEEEHRQAMIDLVGGHPIVCSNHMLEIMFNEPQLLLIFRVALEIEKVYGFPNDSDHSEEPTANIQITGNEIIPLDGALTLTPDHLDDFGTTGEVLYGEPITLAELQNRHPSLDAMDMVNQRAPTEVEPLNLWEELPHEETYWDQMVEEDTTFEVISSPPSERVIGVPLSQNRRVSAPQPLTIIVIDDDDQASYTGSPQGLNNSENTITRPLPQPQAENLDAMVVANNGEAVLIVDAAAEGGINNNGNNEAINHVITPSGSQTTLAPNLDLTLSIGIANSSPDPVPHIEMEDSSSETEDGSGGFGPLF